jgi:hypothetical protein
MRLDLLKHDLSGAVGPLGNATGEACAQTQRLTPYAAKVARTTTSGTAHPTFHRRVAGCRPARRHGQGGLNHFQTRLARRHAQVFLRVSRTGCPESGTRSRTGSSPRLARAIYAQ